MNRSIRRKVGMRVVSDMMKGRQQDVAKKQYGFGIIITNLMCVITFWRWTWVLYDRRRN